MTARIVPAWSTACLDWEERIIARRSLIPFDPLFPEQAVEALEFFKGLRIKDAVGSPTMGEVCLPWVFDLVNAIFGAYDAETGRQLIRHFFLLISKKNGKSTIAAGILLTALKLNWRESGELYMLSPTKEIADNAFFPARDMIALDDNLRALMHVQNNTRTITHRNTDAFLKVVAADSETVGGKKTIVLLVDEKWLFGKRAGAANMIREAKGGLASRPEGWTLDLSTQSDDPPAGVFAEDLAEFRGIRDGTIHDPESLGILYEFPRRLIAARAYEKREFDYITNPNLGLSVDQNFLDHERAKAQRGGQAQLNGFYAKHLNVQIGQGLRVDGWAGAAIWERGFEQELTLEEILSRCEVVTVGLDGGGLDDLLGVALIGRERGTGRWLAWAHGLVSTIGVIRRKANAEKYLEFKRAGELTVFEFAGFDDSPDLADEADLGELLRDALRPSGNLNDPAPDIKFVVDLVVKVRDLGLLAQVGVDAAGIGAIVDALATVGVTQEAETLDAVRQGIGLMNAVKTVERKLADRSFRHGGGPLLSWCVGNLKVIPTRTAMMVARDEAGYGKVDPFMALANAAHLMSLNPDAGGLSIFDQPDSGAQPSDSNTQSGVDQVQDDRIDMDILRDPSHPRWNEMRDRWERQNLSAYDEDAA